MCDEFQKKLIIFIVKTFEIENKKPKALNFNQKKN